MGRSTKQVSARRKVKSSGISDRTRPSSVQADAPVRPGEMLAVSIASGSPKVFIVHGRDEAVLHMVARFIERIGLEIIVMREQPDSGRTIIEKFEDCAEQVSFAVVLLTADDVGALASAPTAAERARQNVICELSYFAGRLGRGRVCLLRKGEIEMPSDLYGVIYTELDPADGWKVKLARELKAAGFYFDSAKVWT
jgi:predicted nucleotide-binding protein